MAFKGGVDMAIFYGTIRGNRGQATKVGSKSSGVTASVQSYEGSIITEIYYKDDIKYCTIGTNKNSSNHYNTVLYDGPLEDLIKGKVRISTPNKEDREINKLRQIYVK